MSFEGAIFDLDGTLLDSLEDIADAMNAVLKERRLPEHRLSAYRYFVGEGVEKLVERALPENVGTPEAVREGAAAMRARYRLGGTPKTRPYAGIPELLDALRALRMPVAVLSNKPHDATKEMVSRLLGRWPLEPVLGFRPEVPRKPHPAGALEIARSLALPPERLLYVGDTATDMETARKAGMHGVGALWGFREAEELLQGGARRLVAHPLELLDLLEDGGR